MLIPKGGNMPAKKLWAGRFATRTDSSVEEFTESISFDHLLYRYDIMGSIAHCRMLSKQKIISAKEAHKIISGLKEIEKEIGRGELEFKPEFEDIHMLIESRLIEKVGPVGGKLHTARSRNDQVALDISLFLRDSIVDIICLIDRIQQELINTAEKYFDVIMPGFTHLQHAQPVLFPHHMMAYFEMFRRDRSRMESCFDRVNRMPLGAGALAGTPYPIDREYVASILGYPSVTDNSIDSVSDRDSLIEFCGISSIIMMHLSRFCEELILWSSSEFQFIEISDAFCTGSSIMPQKKNPDVPELIRGKTGRVYGNLMSLLTLMKSLPLSYNRDLQEDKEAVFDTVDTIKKCLNIFPSLLSEIKINGKKMAEAANSGFLTATDLADYLAAKGMPFRNAHEIVGRIVSYCSREKKKLWDLSPEELKSFNQDIEAEAIEHITIESSVNSRQCTGGTGRKAVKRAIGKAKADLIKKRKFIDNAFKV
jgi:argininosuccinate lyase